MAAALSNRPPGYRLLAGGERVFGGELHGRREHRHADLDLPQRAQRAGADRRRLPGVPQARALSRPRGPGAVRRRAQRWCRSPALALRPKASLLLDEPTEAFSRHRPVDRRGLRPTSAPSAMRFSSPDPTSATCPDFADRLSVMERARSSLPVGPPKRHGTLPWSASSREPAARSAA